MKKLGLWIIASLVLFCELDIVSAKDYVSPTAAEETDVSKKAENLVQGLGNTAIEIINRKGITSEKVKQEFGKLLNENFALENIARYSLGKNFKQLSEDEKKDFLRSFENMLVGIYSSRFSEYKSAKLIVAGSRKKSDKQILVNSKIVIPNKQDIDVVWSIFLSNGSLKVYDAIISDVSISNVQRSELMSRISEKGLKAFLEDFKKKYGQNEEHKK